MKSSEKPLDMTAEATTIPQASKQASKQKAESAYSL